MIDIEIPAGMIPVFAWIRVSSDGQDEENQIPDIKNYCAVRNMFIVKWFELHDRSASKGEQDAKIAEMLADMHAGLAKILVIWHSDRLERRGVEMTFKLLREIREAGGVTESTKEPLLGKLDITGEAMTAITAIISHEKVVHLSDQVKIAHDARRAAGAVIGRPDYGHRIICMHCREVRCDCGPKCKHYKTLEIDPVRGPIAYQMADRYLNQNHTLARICAWTIAEGIKTQQGCNFSPKTLSQVLRNKSIAGRRKQGNTILRIPEIIPLAWFNAIQAKLDSHAHRKGVPPANTALLTGMLYCAKCKGSMYRVPCAGKLRKDGSRAPTLRYYRCHGGVNSPSKCKNMLPLADMDARISDAVMMMGWAPHVARTLVPGDNHDAEIAEVRASIRDLDLDDPDYDDSLATLRGEYARLRALPNEPDRWEERPTGRSVADNWTRLNDAQRRAWLLADGWTVYAGKDEGGTVVVTIGTERAYGTSLETLRTVA